MRWAYGVTTVPERFAELLPRTLASLSQAGFDSPRLFVDGVTDIPPQYRELRGYAASFRYPKVRTFGNWILSLWELYLRDPTADRYAIFQDDFVTYRNLREYLEHCDYPKHGYWNLYTFPRNEKPFKGWYLSNQKGLGAVGLVFNNEAVRTLLASEHMANRPLDPNRGWRKVDGGIVDSFRKAGWQEWVHNPSLVQHTGDQSSMGNNQHAKAGSFMGEEYDAMSLLANPSTDVTDKPVIQPIRTHRIGLVGYYCNSGLGELNRQIASYSELDTWLVKPHPQYQTSQSHPRVDTIVCQSGQTIKLKKFLHAIDTLVFCEQPYYTEIIGMAKDLKKRLVCIPMMEWMPAGARGWPFQVDLFICPTRHCYDQFADTVPCTYFPWPVDTDRFIFSQREVCNKFLYIAGHGGWSGRKGIEVVQRAKEIWPEMPLVVRCQVDVKWPVGTEILPSEQYNYHLYNVGDVLIAPHSVDGLGLEPMEAMSCGMPVITTDGLPWNEIPSIAKIKSEVTRRSVRRPVDWHIPSPESLVACCKQWLGQDIAVKSAQARQWAESRSWDVMSSRFDALVRSGVANQITNQQPMVQPLTSEKPIGA
jgi:glycosyltransferase involved in cell wall biosynthesis